MALGAVATQRVGIGSVDVALDGDVIGFGNEIGSKSGLPAGVIVIGGRPRSGRQTIAIVPVGIKAQRPAVADRQAVADRRSLLAGARGGPRQRPDRIVGVAADDVDNAIDRIWPIQRAARTADHLDLLNVFQDRGMQVPVHRRGERRVDRPAVDQDQQFVARLDAVEAARADRIFAGVDLLDLEVGRQPQRLGQEGCARSGNLIAGDDIKRGRSLA